MKNKLFKNTLFLFLVGGVLTLGFFAGDQIYQRNLKEEKRQWVAHRLAYQTALGVKPGDYLKRVINKEKGK